MRKNMRKSSDGNRTEFFLNDLKIVMRIDSSCLKIRMSHKILN